MPQSLDRQWRDDARQEVELQLLGTAPPEDVAGDPARREAYRRGALRRRLLDILRRESRHAHASLDALPLAAPDHATRDRLAERVHAILAHLREHGEAQAANLLERRFLDGISLAEIGESLGKPPKSVSAQLQRAKKKFLFAWQTGGGGAITIRAALPAPNFSRHISA